MAPVITESENPKRKEDEEGKTGELELPGHVLTKFDNFVTQRNDKIRTRR